MLTLAIGDTMLAMLAAGLIVFVSIGSILLLRGAGFTSSGRALVAGSLAGLLIGPMVFGRVMPERFESMMIGGVKARQDLDDIRRINGIVLSSERLSAEGLLAQHERAQREIAAQEQALRESRWQHQQPLRAFTMIVVALVMLAAATQSVRDGDKRQGWVTPANIGLWSFALPAALTYMIALRWWETSVHEAALLAAAVGIGPWALGAIDRRVADDAEFGGARMMQTAGRIASTLAIALAMWAAWRLRGEEGALLAAPLLVLPVAWLFDLVRRNPGASTRSESASFAIELLMTILAALVAIRIDVFTDFAVWPLIVLALLADDGRWLGAFLGAMLPGGRPALRSMRLVMPAMAAGPTQVALAALVLWGGLLDDRFALPLLAGAILIEVTAPARRRMAAQLIETEQEIEDDANE